MKKTGSLLGAVLLIVGISIGSGMIALPMASAACGFPVALFFLVLAWALTTYHALLLLQVHTLVEEGDNLYTMAKKTLGPAGSMVTTLFYFLLFYTILAVYISVGSDLIASCLVSTCLAGIAPWSGFIFTFFFGMIVYFGVSIVDQANRYIMIGKFLSYGALIYFASKSSHHWNLGDYHTNQLYPLWLTILFSFGFATVIPSLRGYLSVCDLKKAIIIGSIAPLLMYILWIGLIYSVVQPSVLLQIAQSSQPNSMLVEVLGAGSWLSRSVFCFMIVCVFTSFLGVCLSTSDFLIDRLRIRRRWIAVVCACVPPWLIASYYPQIFMKGIQYAGFFAIFLIIWLPGAMMLRSVQMGWIKSQSIWTRSAFLWTMTLMTTVMMGYEGYQLICH